MLIEEVTIGSDIEWFVKNVSTNEIISAEGLIQGTKHRPFKFDSENEFFATSLDNVLAEGNIPPASKPSEFYAHIRKLREYINSTLPNDCLTEAIASQRLDFKYLQTPNSQIFGCDPSLNCWSLEKMQPKPSGDNLRSAGFHIHVGYKDPSMGKNVAIAKALDLFLGVPSVLIEPPNDRKKVGYGLSGNFRHQNHGCEYRSLSSYFASNQELIEWCFNQTMDAINAINQRALKGLNNFGLTIQSVINEENKLGAKLLIKKFNLERCYALL